MSAIIILQACDIIISQTDIRRRMFAIIIRLACNISSATAAALSTWI
jgi:hypothetical protein